MNVDKVYVPNDYRFKILIKNTSSVCIPGQVTVSGPAIDFFDITFGAKKSIAPGMSQHVKLTLSKSIATGKMLIS